MKMFCVALVVHTNSIDSRIPNWNIYYHKIAYTVQDLRFLVTVWIHEHWQWTALHVTCLKLLERTNIPLGQSVRKHCIIHIFLYYCSIKVCGWKKTKHTSSKIWPKFLFEQLPNKKYVHRPWQSIFLVDCSICELSVIVCISFVDISWIKCINKERKHVSLSQNYKVY